MSPSATAGDAGAGAAESEAGAEPAPDETGTALRVLFDVNHPAQVHLFRNAIAALEARGHETFVTSRHKEVTVDLLDAYGIAHDPLTSQGESLPGLVAELLVREGRLLEAARRFDPDVIVSRLGPAPAHASAVLGCRCVVVSDTRADRNALRRLYRGVTLPFVDTVCAPASFDLPVPDERRRPLDFQELAYLHPRYFEPDPGVLERHGIDPEGTFFVLRTVGWDAYHDVGHAGLSPGTVRRLVDLLSVHGEVYISAEGALPPDLAAHELPTDPADVHHVLHYADLYVGDSATMSTEAALLGTPAIRTNTMVGEGDENVFRQLESRYGLLRSFADEAEAFRAVEQLLGEGLDAVDWEARRERLIAERPDVTERMVETILEATDE
jgi:predicted glycosyltransferase